MILPVYAVGVAGAFLQIVAAQWDVSAHILGIVETFFTPAHTVLYTGIALVALASFYGLLLQSKTAGNSSLNHSLFAGVSIAAVGSSLQIIAAPIDFWWHSTYGFDPVLFSPAHVMLILGLSLNCIGALIGSVSLLSLRETGAMRNRAVTGAPLLLIVSGGVVWLFLTLLVYSVTDLSGIRFQYKTFTGSMLTLPDSFNASFNVASLLVASLPALFAITAVRKYSKTLGYATLTTLPPMLIVTLSTLLEGLYFGHPELVDAAITIFLPLTIILLLPALAFDYLAGIGGGSLSGRKYLVACMIMAPMTYFYDIFGSATRSDILGVGETFLIALPLYLLFGAIASKLAPRFAEWLGSRSIVRAI